MIVTEKFQGEVFRYFKDDKAVEPTAIWLLSDDGELKGFMCTDMNLRFAKEFMQWAKDNADKIKK